jgi:small GTP-binding protein
VAVFKVITIGESGVGKTSIIMRYAVLHTQDNIFSHKFMSTIGINFKTKEILIQNALIALQIWDTAGQERFRNLYSNYYRCAHGIAIVYDVTSQHSFDTISNWIESISENAPKASVRVLIANKVDMFNHRVITEQQGKEIAANYKLAYFESSAKDGTGVFEAFDYLAHKIICLGHNSEDEYRKNSSFMLRKKSKEKKKKKC